MKVALAEVVSEIPPFHVSRTTVVYLQSLHTILGQLLLVARTRAAIADSGGSGGAAVAIGTGDGFGVSLVAGGSDLNLLQRSPRGQNGTIWRSLVEPPIVTFILTGH